MIRFNRAGLAVLATAASWGCQSDLTAPASRELAAPAPFASVTFDPATGIGFVGKGDVQTFYGWNNQALQANAANVDFRVSSSEATTWTCTRTWTTGPNAVEHEVVLVRHNSTSINGLLTTLGRNNSQGLNGPNTGFTLSPEGPIVVESEGPPVGSCPASPSGFVYDENAEVTAMGGGGLQIIVTGVSALATSTGKRFNTWYNFPE